LPWRRGAIELQGPLIVSASQKRLAKMKRKSESYNKTKKPALEVLECGTPIDGPTFARKVGIRPVRRVYAYLDHLAVLGLVVRRADLGSKLLFQITERGLKRLEWMRAQDKPSSLAQSLMPLLRSGAIPTKN
jgi:hypothetical protein